MSANLAPWIAEQAQQLLAQRGHAWLLAGPAGLGQYELALALARAWLCDHASAQGACGACPSCHSVSVHTHADLCVLMPESALLELGWQSSEVVESETDGKKRKPSKEIRIEAMRDALEFTQRTNARGRGKVVLVFPAERMNAVTANALLKTLEEPSGETKFVLASEAAHQLLPTIRSRCLEHTMRWPAPSVALAWLQTRGMLPEQAQIALRAAGGRAQEALQLIAYLEQWPHLAQAVRQGDVSFFKTWSPAQTLDALQKLCHDVMAVKAGAKPRFFLVSDLPSSVSSWLRLTGWAKELAQSRRTLEHPFNPALMQEALLSQAQQALR